MSIAPDRRSALGARRSALGAPRSPSPGDWDRSRAGWPLSLVGGSSASYPEDRPARAAGGDRDPDRGHRPDLERRLGRRAQRRDLAAGRWRPRPLRPASGTGLAPGDLRLPRDRGVVAALLLPDALLVRRRSAGHLG